MTHRSGSMVSVLCALLLACSGRHGDDGQGQGGARGSTLTIKGSDTMVILAQRWAEEYMREHQGTTIQVSGGGSGTGIAALINGTTDIANASRPIRDSERRTIAQRRGSEPREYRVALDALAVYVHQNNPLRSLSVTDLARIYRGEVRNWSELGGPDRPIILYSRENNSGTYAFFKERVLGDRDFAATAQTLPGTAAVINAVSRDPGGIGYGGIAYSQQVKVLSIAADGGTAVEPTVDNATSGTYPLARHLYMYTVGEPVGLAKDFVDWVRSPEGQALVEQTGFYPVPADQREGTAPAPAAAEAQ